MLRGWRAQQTARGLREDTIEPRERLVRRFVAFTNEYPWRWLPGHVDEWTQSLMAESHLAPSTIRGYQTDLRLFSEYLCDARYGWVASVREAVRAGGAPGADLPRVEHDRPPERLRGQSGGPAVHPEELQRFLDYADEQVERAVRAKRKGALAAYRDATLFKVVYGVGAAAHRDRRSWMSSTGAATRRRRSSAGSGCCTSATARRCAGSRRGGATCRR